MADSGVTVCDLFCGAGGSSTGLVEAGMRLVAAANHSRIAIETHSANHPTAEHLCEDISRYDMRRLPRTRVLWASPICTEISPAGGRRRQTKLTRGQLALLEYGPVRSDAYERTRATAYDVIRATEVHRYDAVMIENVVEWVTDWELHDWWRDGMHRLGYTSQIVSVNSAHVGGEDSAPAPQWRDRVYVVFVREGIRKPDLTPSPLAWCEPCGEDVYAVQSWRNGHRVGKYRQQYDYRCPRTPCRHSVVEPYVRPAADVIDWTQLGELIGDRKRPLAPATIRRIEAGLSRYTQPYAVSVNHDDLRVYPVDRAPLPTRTSKIGDGLVNPPLLVPAGGTWNDSSASTFDPMRTRTVRDMEAVVTPEPFLAVLRRNGSTSSIRHPVGTITAGGTHHALVIPYYRTGTAKPATDPLDTVTSRDRFALVSGQTVAVEDCRFRMLQPRESLLAQRFPAEYIVHGNKGEQTAQAGNAVSVNVARWIGERLMEVL